jgi:hypothetical protein
MDRRLRRALTVTGSAVGALALFTGTASAHYCYTLKGTDGSKANGQAWATAAQTAAELETFLPPGECRTQLIAHVNALGQQGALFLGPGLLAGGAARKGQLPDSMEHLIEDAMAIDACAFLFE